jgi:hypothetical protein
MRTFNGTYGADPMMASVAQAVDEFEQKNDVQVHTITLILNGQHGEFDLTVVGSDDDMEDVTLNAVAHRHGGVSFPASR